MKVVIIEGTDGACSMCGNVEELRPYGPGGSLVCFDCGMKDEAEAKRQFAKQTAGQDVIVLGHKTPPNEPAS